MSAVTTCYYNDNFNPVIIILIIAGILMLIVFIGFIGYYLLKPKNSSNSSSSRTTSSKIFAAKSFNSSDSNPYYYNPEDSQQCSTSTSNLFSVQSQAISDFNKKRSTRVEKFPLPFRNILLGMQVDQQQQEKCGIENKGFNVKELHV